MPVILVGELESQGHHQLPSELGASHSGSLHETLSPKRKNVATHNAEML